MNTMQQVALLIDAFPGLTRTQALMFAVLADGRTKTRGTIIAQMEADLGYRQSEPNLASVAKRLRRVLPAGFMLYPVYGVGYRLVVPEGWRVPWS